jgi:hypothetical protein
MPFADAGRRSSDRLLGDFVLGKCSTLPRQHGRDLSNDSTLAYASVCKCPLSRLQSHE